MTLFRVRTGGRDRTSKSGTNFIRRQKLSFVKRRTAPKKKLKDSKARSEWRTNIQTTFLPTSTTSTKINGPTFLSSDFPAKMLPGSKTQNRKTAKNKLLIGSVIK